MFNKKIILILTIFIVSLFSISAVNAAVNATDDVVSIEETDAVSVDEAGESVSVENNVISDVGNDNEKNNNNLNELNSYKIRDNDVILSLSEEDDDILGYLNYKEYNVKVDNTSIYYGEDGYIYMSMSGSYFYTPYNIFLKVYDSNNVEKISKQYIGKYQYQNYKILSQQLEPGNYTIKILNAEDNHLMANASLIVTSLPYSAYSVNINALNKYYGSENSVLLDVKKISSSKCYYQYDFYVKVYDSNNVEKISRRFLGIKSHASLQFNFNSTVLSPGSYTLKILNFCDNYVMNNYQFFVVSLPYYAYSVSISNISMVYGLKHPIIISISPASSKYNYKYDFYLKIYDSNNVEKISKRYYNINPSYNVTYSGLNVLNPGVYSIKLFNNGDNYLMGTATLLINNISIETKDVIVNCDELIKYKVRVSYNDKYISGLEVIFTSNGKEYRAITDNQGYATANMYLKAGTYNITTKCEGISNKNTIIVNKVYVENVYKNVYIKSRVGYYNSKNKINYGFKGNLKGYFKIYKGKRAVYKKNLNTNGIVSEAYVKHNYCYDGSAINAVGTYKAVITDVKGKVLAKNTIKINKAPTHTICYSFSTLIGTKEYIDVSIFDAAKKKIKTSGKVKFKIAGKTYTVKFKKGFGCLIIKLPLKAKKYKCSVKFLGNKDYRASSTQFTISLVNSNVLLLKKNRIVKVGKYAIKLSPKQYKALVKAFNKEKSKSFTINTKYYYKVYVPYTKTVRTYKTTKACYTIYYDYKMVNKRMRNAGWSKVSEYKYDVKNPRNKYGIGLSAYTYAVSKWVKVSYKTAYKTKYYPINAKIVYLKDSPLPEIKVYSHGKTFCDKFLAIV